MYVSAELNTGRYTSISRGEHAREADDAEYWNRISLIYDQLYSGIWSQMEDLQTEAWLGSLLKSRTRITVLDLACGTGLGLSLLNKRKIEIEYHGLDMSVHMLTCLQKKFPTARVFRGSLSDPSQWPQGPFDVVLALNGVLSFSSNIKKTMSGISSRMALDGLGYISAFNRWAMRRLLHLKFSAIESYRTRGANPTLGSVRGHMYSKNEICEFISGANLNFTQVFRQGCLAGLVEWPPLWPLETGLQKTIPGGSHLLSFAVQRS